MLFSNDQVASYINKHFEPAWESVRPVPLVTVDFGDGHVIRRTLRGNIATYVCDASGLTLDILPGIYEPTEYLKQLQQLELLSRWAKSDWNDSERVIQDYHRKQYRLLEEGKPRGTIVAREVSRASIIRVESGIRYLLSSAGEKQLSGGFGRGASLRRAIPDLDSPEELSEWKPLFEDTARNESIRRKQIHKFLADKRLIRPSSITKWLYREVLDADLDDPYLGLGKILKQDTADAPD